jgi:hypothetical protein
MFDMYEKRTFNELEKDTLKGPTKKASSGIESINEKMKEVNLKKKEIEESLKLREMLRMINNELKEIIDTQNKELCMLFLKYYNSKDRR